MSDESDNDWQEDYFKLMRVIIGVVVEYSSLVEDADSPAGWALSDLRDVNHELLKAIESADEEGAKSLAFEAKVFIADIVRLVE